MMANGFGAGSDTSGRDPSVFAPELGLFTIFQAWADQQPDAPAVLCDDKVVSYAALSDQAGRISAALRAAGAQPGDRIGLVAHRSPEAIAAILGILRAGAAYVPLDPTHAADQLGFIAEDLSLTQALALPCYLAEAAALDVAVCDLREAMAFAGPVPEAATAAGEDVAHVLYTSGTTGHPKGVVIPHRAVVAHSHAQPYFEMTPRDVVLHTLTIAADGATFDIWGALLNGASVAVVAPVSPSLDDIAQAMTRHQVTAIGWYAGLHHMMIDHRLEAFASVRMDLSGGDVMSAAHARTLLERFPNIRLINAYGPTETTVDSLWHHVTLADLEGEVPIGKPCRGDEVFVVDDDLTPLPPGTTGQLVIAGAKVAQGYHNRPDKTAAAFISDPRPGQSGNAYLTGDLARETDGVFHFHGRVDRQVKLGGRRIELDGIEHILRDQPNVQDAAVVVLGEGPGRRLAAALILAPGATAVDAVEGADLHPELKPREVRVVDAFPLTSAGKVDRRAVAAAFHPDRVEMPSTDLEALISEIWSGLLGGGPFGPDTTFFEAGGNSLLLLEAHAQLETRLERRFDVTLMFDHGRLGALASALSGAGPAPAQAKAPRSQDTAIAITGMAARLPGVNSLDAFWEAVQDGRSLITQFDATELEDDPVRRQQPGYVAARPILADVDLFDAKFWGMLPKEAAQTDPQARVFLELCQEALDAAGIDPARAPGPVGVWAGQAPATYLMHHLMPDRAAIEDYTETFFLGDYTQLTGNSFDSLATRAAFKLDLKGPAISLGTACSTSLTAIAEAVTALRAGQTDVALAGGVTITFPQHRGYVAQEGGMASPDGVCRPFDAQAAGTVFGHGAGVVVLRRLDDALATGDHIHAVIRGVGLNNDGADKVAFTAPSVTGQAGAITLALQDAGLSASDIGYVEAHGTATPLGDPIEVAGLTRAYGEAAQGSIGLGSVKGTLGHLDAAAGVVSLIKAAMVVERGVQPPLAHFTAPNPRIDFDTTPFHVPTQARGWDGPRRAGVSSFGVGGTNAHVILEHPPVPPAVLAPDAPQILPLSAKTPKALKAQAEALADALRAPEPPALGDVAFTLQEGRRVHGHRLAIAASSAAEAAEALAQARVTEAAPREIVFMFPGQGAQYPGMGRGLYQAEPEFARWIDAGCDTLAPWIDADLHRLLTASDLSDDEAAAALRETRLTQPALYLTQYATAKLWAARGIRPDRMVGHSVGEFTAAALAGVFSFEDGLRIIAARGRLMQDMAPGAMLSVRADWSALDPHMTQDLDLAARNGPGLQVVAGPEDAIAALKSKLSAAEIPAKRLHTSHAFHSQMMDPVLGPLTDEIAKIPLAAPIVPLISAVTGARLTGAEATDPAFWAAQARATVNFEAAIQAAMPDPSAILVEQGAGATLSTFATRTLGRGGASAILQSLPDHAQAGASADQTVFAASLGRLWATGVDVAWAKAGPRGARKVPLPGTVFIRKRHWVDPPARQSAAAPVVPDIPLSAPLAQPESSRPVSRLPRLTAEITALLSDLSGEDLTADDSAVPFLELGFDSLFMGQVAQALGRDYGVSLTFRSLMADYPSIEAVVAYLDGVLPAEAAGPEPTAQPLGVPGQARDGADPVAMPTLPALPEGASGDVGALIQAQMQVMQSVFAEQLRALGTAVPDAAHAPVAAPAIVREAPEPPVKSSGFKTGRGPNLAAAELTEGQRAFASDLAVRYAAKYPKSKGYTAQHRGALADPRTVSGFRPEWKELVFPVVAERAKGAYIWDVDGHQFMDLVNGFGQTAFGHSPDFVTQAVAAQMERGYPIGPQAAQAGPVAEKFAAAVGHERVTFCNTGSEAVMAAMRLARAVTGREKIAVFTGDYHGQFDEVLIKGKSRGAPGALPIAPGIPRSGLANMVVLPYGTDETQAWLAQNMGDLAAVIVEPVQSRSPDLRPDAFCRAVHQMARTAGTAFVMDEVVTGFRTHPRGMQGVWDLPGDMATYGKVVGGGMPIGVLAGDAKWMDALDGGAWSFGDDSEPQVAPTFFAGTFVRHPLVLAAVDATLDHIAGAGARLYTEVAERTERLTEDMRAAVVARGLPGTLVEGYTSWFSLNVTAHDPRATLLYPMMRLEGVHLLDGFCGFFTTAHEEADYVLTLDAFERSLDTLQAQGILTADGQAKVAPSPSPEAPLLLTEPVQPAAPTKGVPLTEGQREIWLTHQLGDQAAASFNEGVQMRLTGRMDQAALGRALTALVTRHDALRMVFAKSGESFDVIAPYPLSPEAEPADPETTAKVLAEEGAHPLDITAAPPFRVRLLRHNPQDHTLILVAHHIAVDGWSYGTLMTELAALYTEETGGAAADLPPAQSYAAYAVAEAANPMAPETLNHWKEVYADPPALPDLPTDRPRAGQKSFAGATTTAWLPGDLVKAAKKAGAKHGCTLFATVFGALQMVLGRLSGSEDVVIGVPTGGQALLDDPSLVGHCVHFLPVRVPFAASDVAGHLGQVSTQIMAAFDHQRTTYGALVRDLEIPRTLGRLPLTEVEYNLERGVEDLPMGELTVDSAMVPKAAVNFDLFFNMTETRAGLRIDVNYATDLYDASTVQRWIGHLNQVLSAIAEGTDQTIASLPLMADGDAEAMHLAPTQAAVPLSRTLDGLVAAMAAQTPEGIALEDAAGVTSYAQLMTRVDAIATMVQARVPGQGARIAVALPRGASMVAALLGVLRAGHTYVPLEPTHPAPRLQQILETADVAAVLTEGAPAWAAGRMTCDPATAPLGAKPAPVQIDPEAAAYVIFTSGSTGTPKGVEVPHRAVVNFLASMAVEPGLSADTVLLAVTTVTFDIAVLELFGPLTTGGRVVVAPREMVLDGFGLVNRIAEGDITHVQATPTLWAMLLDAGLDTSEAHTLLAGGEPLPQDLAERLMSGGAALWNMYGPTETTIWSAVNRLRPGAPVTIGHPVANTSLHVLDAGGRPCVPGAVGELNIGGAGLALGYLGRPDLTDAAFRDVALGDGSERLYATGDLAQRLPSGEIRVLGRRDGQVKLRGFRIELGEIEARLRASPHVAKAAVDLRVRANGDKRLVAWVVPTDGFDPATEAARLAEALPDYMVPKAWETLDRLPETANGKLDRKALPEPSEALAPVTTAVPPETETERKIAAIWADVLGVDSVGVTDTLYALGADSLVVFRIAARCLDAGLGLEARHLLAHPTIRDLAQHHDGQGASVPKRPSLRDFRHGARRTAGER